MSSTALRSAAGSAAAWTRLFQGGFLRRLRAAAARHEARQALARLDDRLLADVGLTREQARREAAKPFWMS